jgi:GTP-binding protein Era
MDNVGVTHSGFVAFVGRPNVGKSSLVNTILGRKVSIVSDKPQTTRHRIHGGLTVPPAQVIFVDTPGLHKPVSALGQRVNATALASSDDVDISCLVIDATQSFGSGDQWVVDNVNLARDGMRFFVIINKVDIASREKVLSQLVKLSALNAEEYFPVSAKSGEGVDALKTALLAAMPEGPMYYPPNEERDTPEAEWVAELVREELLALVFDELPYSIATRVTEWEWPRVRCEIVVERDSQKGMVIGKKGAILKQVGERVRMQMAPGAFIELHVVVDKNWQQRADRVERLGY